MKRACQDLCQSFQRAMNVLGKPWTGLLLGLLEEDGPRRFSELGERIPALGDRMLSMRLRELEGQGVVERRVLEGPPVRVEYVLTDVGREFGDVAKAIGRWGERLPEPKPAASPAGKTKRARTTQRGRGAA